MLRIKKCFINLKLNIEMQLQDKLGSIMYHESIQPTFSKFNAKKVTFSYLSLRMALVSLVFQFSWLNLWRGE